MVAIDPLTHHPTKSPIQITHKGRFIHQRMLMEGLDPVRVFDGGADGDLDTPADNTLFLTQGIFVP